MLRVVGAPGATGSGRVAGGGVSAALNPLGVAAISSICFSEAGVASCRLPHDRFVCLPSGSFFVHRMLAAVGMLRITADAEYACRTVIPGRRVALGTEFHVDLES